MLVIVNILRVVGSGGEPDEFASKWDSTVIVPNLIEICVCANGDIPLSAQPHFASSRFPCDGVMILLRTHGHFS